jgi:ABC-2 type transport system permease protein
MKILVSQIKLENRLFLREKEAIFWTLAFPVFLIALFGLIWKDETWGDLSAINWLLPGIIVMALMTTCFLNNAMFIVEQREKGIFRRISLTPLKKHILIIGQLVNRYLIVLLQTLILIALAVIFFGARVQGNLALFWVVLSIGALSFLALGFAIAGLIKSEKSAHPITMIIFFPLMFLGGCVFPIDAIPGFLHPFCEVLPSLHLNDALRAVVTGGTSFGEIWQDLLILGGWLVVCSAIAVKFFRWG